MRSWWPALATLALVRAAISLAALAAEGRALPGLPRFDYEGLTGDATGYYAASREFVAAWGRLHPALVATALGCLVVVAVVVVRMWRRPDLRAWAVVIASGAAGLFVALGISAMDEPGAAVFGWSLVWSVPMFPLRALGVLDADVAFGLAVALSLLANAVTLVATAYAALYASGRRAVGLAAAALLASWPFWSGLVAGSRSWENGTWRIDAGLHGYTEPLSTALVTVALALLLRSAPSPTVLAFAGAALGLATAVKLSNGILAALAFALVVVRSGSRRALPFALAGLAALPIVAAYWPLSHYREVTGTRDEFGLDYVLSSWENSLLFSPRTLAILLPLAVIGVFGVRRLWARGLLLAWIVPPALFYSFYELTAQHPRFLFASLPALLVLEAAGAAMLGLTLSRRAGPAPE